MHRYNTTYSGLISLYYVFIAIVFKWSQVIMMYNPNSITGTDKRSTILRKEIVFRQMEGKLGKSGTLDDEGKVGKSSDFTERSNNGRGEICPLNFAI